MPKKNVQKKRKAPFPSILSKSNVMVALLWFTAGIIFITFLSTTNARDSHFQCNNISIVLDQNEEQNFLSESELYRKVVEQVGDPTVEEVLIPNIQLAEIESSLSTIPYVKSVESHVDLSGKLFLSVSQEKVIARIFSANDSYYLNENGALMPVPTQGTARLMVVDGEVLNEEGSLKDSLFDFIQRVNSNAFLKAMVEAVRLEKHDQIQITTKMGKHTLELGALENVESKLDRLEMFFKKGLAATDWEKCKRLNFAFENQIICSK